MQNVPNKRHFFLLCLAINIFLLSEICVPVGICEDAVYKEEFEIILKQLDTITERIEGIEDQQGVSKEEETPEETLEILQDDMDELTDILDEVERKSLMDRLEFRAELRTRFDWYDFTGHDTITFTSEKIGDEKQETVHTLPTNRLRLNLYTGIGSWLKFHSRLSMTHIWADDDSPIYPEINLINESRIPSDIALKVERVYADIFFEPIENLPMALTFGRLPTTDGFPTNLREDSARKSTYPSLAYDMEADGMGLSIDLSHFTGLKNSAFRFVYIRRCEDHESYSFGKILTTKKGIYRTDDLASTNINSYISQFETPLPGIFHNTLFLLHLVYIPQVPPQDMRFSDDAYQFYYDETGFLFVDKPESIGIALKATGYLESTNFLNLNIDAFLGASYIKSKAQGALKFMIDPSKEGLPGPPVQARDAYDIYKPILHSFPSLVPVLEQLQNAPPAIGLICNNDHSDKEGYAFHLGGRYQLPLFKNNNPKIGIEYNYGSQYWMGFSEASEDPLHKLSNRGSTWDFYYIQPVNCYLTFRLGFTDMYKDYDHGIGFYFGEPGEVDHHIQNTYFLMDARF
jgi:hypothetical protein